MGAPATGLDDSPVVSSVLNGTGTQEYISTRVQRAAMNADVARNNTAGGYTISIASAEGGK